MTEPAFEDWWSDKTILLPKGLLIEGVCGEELAVYAKMKSFGPQARASLKALALRLGWDEKKVRKYQASLWEKGWIFLMVEGGNKKPRHWYLANDPGEQPTDEILQAAAKGAMIPKQPFQGTQNRQGTDFVPPTKSAPETNKVFQTNNTPSIEAEAKKAKGQAIGILLKTFKDLWEAKYKDKYDTKANPQDGKTAEWMWAEGHSVDLMKIKASQFFESNETWLLQKRHAFWQLKWKWNDLSGKAVVKSAYPEFVS